MTEAERQILGDALRFLRRENFMTQAEVAVLHDTDAPAICRYECGRSMISPAKALDMITSMVTVLDADVVNTIMSAIPPLRQELSLRQVINKAAADDALLGHGTITAIAAEFEGQFSYHTIRARVKKARGGN